MDSEDSSLVAETIGGRPEAFRPLVEKYQDRLFDLAFRLVRQREEAEDIVQTALVRIYTHLDRYDPAHSFSNWAYTVTLNVARNHIRRKAVLRFFSLDRPRDEAAGIESIAMEPADARQDMDAHVRGREILSEIHTGVSELPWRLRESFVLHYFHHMPIETISAVTNENSNTVKLRLFRARKALYPRLAGRFPAELDIDPAGERLKEEKKPL